MNDAFYVSAVGLQSQQRALDILAENMANLNTPAFKRSQVRFAEVARLGADAAPSPDGGSGLVAQGVPTIDQPGELQRTGEKMDIAIQGAGFIELMGANGQSLLWRGGTLRVGSDGLLAASNGLPLKAAITVSDDMSAITIGSDGKVYAQTGNDESMEVGQILLTKVDDAASLESVQGGLYRLSSSARAIEAQPGEDGVGSLVQGAIEQSNVNMSSEMVQLMLVQRAYGANAQIVQAADQMMAIANSLRK